MVRLAWPFSCWCGCVLIRRPFPPGNLPTERVTKRDLFHIFHKYGKLAQISIKQAYGFIQFLESGSCKQALDVEQGAVVRGRKVRKYIPDGTTRALVSLCRQLIGTIPARPRNLQASAKHPAWSCPSGALAGSSAAAIEVSGIHSRWPRRPQSPRQRRPVRAGVRVSPLAVQRLSRRADPPQT